MKILTYAKSEYAPAFGYTISKRYKNLSATTLHAGDRVQVDIAIQNTTNNTLIPSEYLDTIPNIFSQENTEKYILSLSGSSEERTFTPYSDTYDALFTLKSIPAGQTLHIIYEVEALPTQYGEMTV